METVCSRGLFDKIVHTVVLKDAFSLFGAFAAAETIPNRLRADADDFRLDSFRGEDIRHDVEHRAR